MKSSFGEYEFLADKTSNSGGITFNIYGDVSGNAVVGAEINLYDRDHVLPLNNATQGERYFKSILKKYSLAHSTIRLPVFETHQSLKDCYINLVYQSFDWLNASLIEWLNHDIAEYLQESECSTRVLC